MNTVIGILVLFALWDILSRILNSDQAEWNAERARTRELIKQSAETTRKSREWREARGW